MWRSRVWPNLHPEKIVYEDEALVAVDKPAGVNSQRSGEARADDIVTRLRLHLGERDGNEPYLGTHQRIDKEISGVVLYTKQRRFNSAIAAQFEGCKVIKSYAAGIEGMLKPSTLHDHLVPIRGNLWGVQKGGGPRAKEALTRIVHRETRRDRTLLELQIERGRTHQIRAQLAHRHAPVVGDRLYGGSRAHRMLLHARELECQHPDHGRSLTIQAALPPSFDRWFATGDASAICDDDLPTALFDAAERRWWLAQEGRSSTPTTAFRWIDGETDGLKGVYVDVIGDHALIQLHEGEHRVDEPMLCELIGGFGFRGVYVKRRPKASHTLVDPRDERWAPKHAVVGEDAPDELEVYENGIPYCVRLSDGLGTGLYLDQRNNRRWVAEASEGLKVLNLFAYTGGFSMAAAQGGAKEVTTVDVSSPALARAKNQLDKHGYSDSHRIVRADVFGFLRSQIKRGQRYDLVIVDPPTHSTVKKQRWASGKGWTDLAELATAVTEPSGRLLCCSNDRRMGQQAFRKHLHAGLVKAGRQYEQIKDRAAPEDFDRGPYGRGLKTVLIVLR